MLRPPASEDAPRIVELCCDPLISWNTARIPNPLTRSDADAFIAHVAAAGDDSYALAITREAELIGFIGIGRSEGDVWQTGYWVGADYRGQGFATEALRAVVAFARDELGAAAIVAGQFVDNPESGAVLMKAGFVETGGRTMTLSVGRGREVETINFRIDFAN
jgi:RimJ/RimL family protein N-acetyltransferase